MIQPTLLEMQILFYSDSPFYGGHEKMTVLIANTLIEQGVYHVHFCYSCSEIPKMLDGRATKFKLPFATKLPLPFLRNLSIKDIMSVKNLLYKIKPEIFVVSQGDIEYGLKGLVGAKLAGVPVISYLPMAYTFKEMNAKMPLFRDNLDNFYYRIPSQFITIGKYQANLLRRFTDCRIHIVRNPIMDENLFTERKEKLHNRFRKRKTYRSINIALIGRVVFRQKNQKAFIPVAKVCRKNGIKAKWHIIGNGPDLPLLKKIVDKEGLSQDVFFYGWIDKGHVRRILRDVIDIVFIPSFFEGMPLVLLESVAAEIPFLVPKFDWVNDFCIPQGFVVNFSETEEVCQTLIELSKTKNSNKTKKLKETFQDAYSIGNFKKDVNNVFLNI